MKQTLLIVLLIAASPAIGQVKTSQPVDSPQDRDVLLKLTDEIIRAKSKRDIDVLERIFADDYNIHESRWTAREQNGIHRWRESRHSDLRIRDKLRARGEPLWRRSGSRGHNDSERKL